MASSPYRSNAEGGPVHVVHEQHPALYHILLWLKNFEDDRLEKELEGCSNTDNAVHI